jgi:hypothetical protein
LREVGCQVLVLFGEPCPEPWGALPEALGVELVEARAELDVLVNLIGSEAADRDPLEEIAEGGFAHSEKDIADLHQ